MRIRAVWLLLATLWSATQAGAELIVNGSFEAPAGFFAGTQGAVPPGWHITHFSPDLYSNDGSFGLPAPFGGNFTGVAAQDQLGWIAGWSVFQESFSQMLPVALEPGVSYTFEGHLIQAKRSDLDHPGGYEILLNGSNTLDDAVVIATTSPTTDADHWEAVAESFVAPPNADDLPWIIFRPYALGAGDAYPGLDNISLSANVPEPRATLLALLALGSLAGMATKNRRLCERSH